MKLRYQKTPEPAIILQPEPLMSGVAELTKNVIDTPYRSAISFPRSQPRPTVARAPQSKEVKPKRLLVNQADANNTWQIISIIGQEVFQASLVTYLLLTLVETLREGFVSNFFNINYLLLVVLVSGVAMVLTEQSKVVPRIRKRASRAIIILAVRAHRREQTAAQANHIAQTPLRSNANRPRSKFVNL